VGAPKVGNSLDYSQLYSENFNKSTKQLKRLGVETAIRYRRVVLGKLKFSIHGIRLESGTGKKPL
jgi:hypothetical protein